jgi:hypothetical protein
LLPFLFPACLSACRDARPKLGLSMMELIKTVVLRSADPEPAAWFRGALNFGDAGVSAPRFRASFAGAGRHLGGATARLSPEQRAQLRQAGVGAPERWQLDAFARAALLLHAVDMLPPERHPQFVRELYRRGDFREQAAVLQALILLPDPGRFVALAVEACRTNVRDVFEAIACETWYPARYFADANFNQMVIKAFFIGLAVSRIAGLERRNTAELRRMAADYASERRAAGRSVPDDLDHVLT